MATALSANVTKYDAGGSGDNIISDGYIKSVEKVWIDSYAVTAAIPSSTSICIARLKKNQKVTEIIVHLPPVGTGDTKVHCGTGATTSTSQYFGVLTLDGDAQGLTIDTGTAGTVRLNANAGNFGTALPADQGVFLTLDPATSLTGVTIRSIVKYTY